MKTWTWLRLAIVVQAVIMGSFIGWTARGLTTRDAIQTAAAEAYLAERDYYNKQAEAIIAEGGPKKGARK